jgi:hypothetical protein
MGILHCIVFGENGEQQEQASRYYWIHDQSFMLSITVHQDLYVYIQLTIIPLETGS